MREFNYTDEWGRDHTLTFKRGQYAMNGRLAVEAWSKFVDDDGEECWEPYASITVNLWEPIDGEDCAYLDLNDSEALCLWILDQGFASLIPRVAESGFCTYIEARFTTEFLNDFCTPLS